MVEYAKTALYRYKQYGVDSELEEVMKEELIPLRKAIEFEFQRDKAAKTNKRWVSSCGVICLLELQIFRFKKRKLITHRMTGSVMTA